MIDVVVVDVAKCMMERRKRLHRTGMGYNRITHRTGNNFSTGMEIPRKLPTGLEFSSGRKTIFANKRRAPTGQEVKVVTFI